MRAPTADHDSPAAAAASAALGALVGTFSAVSTVWLAVLGFAGGTVPVVGWTLPGGLVGGLAWLAVLATAGVVVLWVVPLTASMLIYAGLSRLLVPAVTRRPHAIRPARPRRFHDAKHAA